MYTAQAFLAPTSRHKTGPVASTGPASAGLEARRAWTHRALAHHRCDVLQIDERIAPLGGAGSGACLSLNSNSSQATPASTTPSASSDIS